jgi:hypothetical protein
LIVQARLLKNEMKMSWKDKKTTWGAVFVLVASVWPVYSWLDSEYIFSEAQGADIILAMNEREIDHVRRLITQKETLIVETKYRSDIGDQAKEELITLYREEVRILKLKEACLERDELNC